MARILAADDNKMVRVFYEGVLSYLGQDYEICKDGREALESFRRAPADLVILDVDMPCMNGFECCKAIRSLPEGVMVPVVIVSSHDDEAHVSKGLDAGANDYLVKPVKEAHLIAKLRNFLRVSAFRKTECDLIKERAIVGGRYRIERMLGSGSHSTVFLVSDTMDSDRPLALKMLKESASCDEISKPFFETAAKLKNIQSGQIVKILDMGQSGCRPYIVMECVDGGDLAEILKRKGRLPEEESARMGLDIAKALADLHGAGIIHLDLKPENILRDSATGAYKLADFGIITMRSTATMPLNAEIWSTLAYIPPEYFSEDAEVGLSSDIYSLGVTLYQCMTGDNPFLCERPAITMFRHMNFVPPSLDSCDKLISSKMSNLVASMLDKRMDARPSAAQAVELLEDMIANPESRGMKVGVPEASADKTAKVKEAIDSDKVKEKVKADRKTKGRVERKAKTASLLFAGAITIPLALLCLAIGYLLNWTLFGSPDMPGAVVTVDCQKCGAIDSRRVVDIAKTACAKCGGHVGYAMKCNDCGKVFPMMRPKGLDEVKDRTALAEAVKKSKHCPSCGSNDTSPLLPAASAPPPQAVAAKSR